METSTQRLKNFCGKCSNIMLDIIARKIDNTVFFKWEKIEYFLNNLIYNQAIKNFFPILIPQGKKIFYLFTLIKNLIKEYFKPKQNLKDFLNLQ